MRTKFLKAHTPDEGQEMNDAQFSALINEYRTEDARANPNQLAHGLKLRARAWSDHLKAFRLSGVDEDTREAVRDELELVRNQLNAVIDRL